MLSTKVKRSSEFRQPKLFQEIVHGSFLTLFSFLIKINPFNLNVGIKVQIERLVFIFRFATSFANILEVREGEEDVSLSFKNL